VAKRAFDILVSAVVLLFLTPILLVVAGLVRLDSRGPVFFRHRRMGRGGEPFGMLKFRTMVVGADRMGSRLTLKRDPRITRVGQVLRWLKLDELPQLFNVLRGDMSLIGPRPEDPYFLRFYGPEERTVLGVRPGILGPGQILGRDEQELFPDNAIDPEGFYVEHILPGKLAVDRRYVETASFWGDVGILARGAWAVVATSFKRSFLRRNVKRAGLLATDLVLIALAYGIAFVGEFGLDLGRQAWLVLARTLGLMLVVQPLFLVYYGLYVRTPQFFSLVDAIALLKAVTLGWATVVALTFLSGLQSHSRAVFLEEWSLALLLLGGLRLGFRLRRRDGLRAVRDRALLAGAGRESALLVRGLLQGASVEPVALIDENPEHWGSMIHGLTVLGGEGQIGPARATHGVKTVIVAAGDTRPEWQQAVLIECARLGMECRVIPGFRELLSGGVAEVRERTPVLQAGRAIAAVPEG
jgi:lipopolysaccharide/colanic/teichoic acid biosynthesis glycosyltransferase